MFNATKNAQCDFGVISWAIIFGGFRQKTGRPSGSFNLWRKVHAQFGANRFRSEFRAWNDDVDEVANLVFHASRSDLAPNVNVAGYSWGGAAALRFCRRLADRGIEVDRVVLSDPVYRHCYFAGNWRAFVPGSRIRVPENVRRVDWFRQRVDFPGGHDLVCDDPGYTLIAEPIELCRRHVWMDDAPEYHATFLRALQGEFE